MVKVWSYEDLYPLIRKKDYIIMRDFSRVFINIFVIFFTLLIVIMTSWRTNSQPGNPIKVGILYSDGRAEVSAIEVPVMNALLLAIDEINKEGGVLGRLLECVFVDPQVLEEGHYAIWAEFLIQEEGVEVIFGGRDSLQRKAIKFIIEQNNKLLFYPFSYEGLESSEKVIYTGSVPNQYLFPSFYWACQTFREGHRYIMVHSPSLKGRALYAIAKDALKIYSNAVLESIEFSSDASAVTESIASIFSQKPNVLFETLDSVGEKVSFYRRLKNEGWSDHYGAVISLGLSDLDVYAVGPHYFDGYYFSRNYFSKKLEKLLAKLTQSFGQTHESSLVVGQAVESAYVSVYLWARAVAKAGTLDPSVVLQDLLQQNYESPLGRHFLDRTNNHIFMHFMIGRLDAHGNFAVVTESKDLIKPEPFPVFRPVEDWRALLEGLLHK